MTPKLEREPVIEPCIACAEKRQHTVNEWREWHPLARHGYAPEHGWTHPTLNSLALLRTKE